MFSLFREQSNNLEEKICKFDENCKWMTWSESIIQRIICIFIYVDITISQFRAAHQFTLICRHLTVIFLSRPFLTVSEVAARILFFSRSLLSRSLIHECTKYDAFKSVLTIQKKINFSWIPVRISDNSLTGVLIKKR